MSQGFSNNTGISLPLSVAQGGTSSATGSLTNMNGTQNGTTTNDDAAAGKVGEFVSSVIAQGSAIALSDGVNANITSITLSAGDWDIWGNVNILDSGGIMSYAAGWISATSATLPDREYYNTVVNGGTNNLVQLGISTPSFRVSTTGSPTYYLSCVGVIISGTINGCGGIYARRVR